MTWEEVIARLRILDAKQWKEIFHDIDDIEQIQTICNAAHCFVEQFCENERVNLYEEWKQIDDARRAREYKSDNERPY